MTRARDLGDFIADGAAAELVVDTTTLVVDSTNNRVGVGTASPSQALDVSGTGNFTAVTAGTLTIDDITINGSTISDGGDFTLDVGGNIIFDADGGYFQFKDGGTEIVRIFTDNSGDVNFNSMVQDKDIHFHGNDGGADVLALILDMSEQGQAQFNHDVWVKSDTGKFYAGASGDLEIYHNGTNSVIYDNGTGNLQLVSNGASVDIIKAGGENMATFATDGAVTLYYDNSAKLATTSTGVDVTGEFIADSYNETYVSLSAAATVNIDCHTGNVFALTTNQNTTFTFSNPPASGTSYGFTLKLTAGGTHTITYPNTVDFAGGTAPDAPASGETDVLVFFTVDGGTNWYAALAIDAAG